MEIDRKKIAVCVVIFLLYITILGVEISELIVEPDQVNHSIVDNKFYIFVRRLAGEKITALFSQSQYSKMNVSEMEFDVFKVRSNDSTALDLKK